MLDLYFYGRKGREVSSVLEVGGGDRGLQLWWML
jgi:hypothetical protein